MSATLNNLSQMLGSALPAIWLYIVTIVEVCKRNKAPEQEMGNIEIQDIIWKNERADLSGIATFTRIFGTNNELITVTANS